jgi:branched-chain amino acid transport system ATP-binding protein
VDEYVPVPLTPPPKERERVRGNSRWYRMDHQDMNIIKTEGVTKKFGGFVAVDHVDFTIGKNETVGIIGPNGAGKTTFLNLITGFYPPDNGTIWYNGRDITTLSPEKRVEMGMVRTFQLVRVFNNLRVYENLGLAHYRKKRGSSLPLHIFVSNLEQTDIRKRVDESLGIFELGDIAEEMVGNLSLGSKRKLEITMAFIADPVLLALDEPFSGLSDKEILEVMEVFKRLKHQKTILIIEHKISKLMDFVDRLAVMHEGKIVACGSPQETLEDPEVRRVYWKVK